MTWALLHSSIVYADLTKEPAMIAKFRVSLLDTRSEDDEASNLLPLPEDYNRDRVNEEDFDVSRVVGLSTPSTYLQTKIHTPIPTWNLHRLIRLSSTSGWKRLVQSQNHSSDSPRSHRRISLGIHLIRLCFTTFFTTHSMSLGLARRCKPHPLSWQPCFCTQTWLGFKVEALATKQLKTPVSHFQSARSNVYVPFLSSSCLQFHTHSMLIRNPCS